MTASSRPALALLQKAQKLLSRPAVFLTHRPEAEELRPSKSGTWLRLSGRHIPADTYLARNHAWLPCGYDDPRALAWTLEGALARVAGNDLRGYLQAYQAVVVAAGADSTLDYWAKRATFGDVQRVLRLACLREEREEVERLDAAAKALLSG